VVKYHSASSSSATTYIMAVSASAGGVPAIVSSGPIPASQTLLPNQSATFTVGVSGTQPISGYWEVENNGTFVPLADGLDANGSTVSGSHTLVLTITNLFVADGTNYQFVAGNIYGTNTSPVGALIVNPQTVTITPATPVSYTGNNIPLTVNLSAGPAVTLQWYFIDNSSVSNAIPGATNVTYTVTNVTTAMSGYTYGVIAANTYGTNIASVILSVSDSQAFLGSDLAPTNAEAYAGAPVTYTVNAQGNAPITYQWTVNGGFLAGGNSNSFTIATPCGTTTIQVAFSNALSGGTWVMSSVAVLQGDASPTNITFNTNGAGWQTNGSVPIITNNVLQLTDGGGGESSSAFYKTAQFVGGAWTASYTYNSHNGAADGTAFVLQTTNPAVVGGGGGQLGYAGIAGPSLAFEINLYGGNNETPGITLARNGATGVYQSAAPINFNGTNDINVRLNWANGVLSVLLTDAVTGTNYSTNYVVGPISSVLGGTLAYVGFTGADGGATSDQTVSNFQFHSVLPPVALSVSPVTGNSVVISWPAADPSYVLQTNVSLTTPLAWGAGPAPVLVGGTNQVTVNVHSGLKQVFYRLNRVACP
jgi:hypothetical protein